MPISIRLKDNFILANGFKVVDLHQPFSRILDIREGKIPTPAETLISKNLSPYYCKIAKRAYGVMYRLYSDNIKCHGIYQTEKLSLIIKGKALDIALSGNSISCDIQEEIDEILTIVLRCLVTSFDFNCVITDCNTLSMKMLKVPVFHPKWCITNLDDIPLFHEQRHILNALIERYGKIPLNILDRTINEFKYENTNIELGRIDQYDRILIIMNTNKYYANFLSKLIYKELDGKQVLPTVLFIL